MKANQIQVGTKLTLNVNGKEREYKVTEISENGYKLFNKFQVSFYASLEFINQNLAS
jgi:ribosomal 50S subunit-recycling heat shock protein